RDYDLCLIEVGYGPMLYACPVVPAGHHPAHLWSCGYDEMRDQMTVKSATLRAGYAGRWHEVLTAEAPWHGRSGGPLLDADKGYLIGTVIGYSSRRDQA